MNGSNLRRFTFHAPRWVVLSVAVVVAAVGGVRVVPWAAAATSTGDRAIFEPLVPARILDTRQPPANPLGPNESRVLQVTGAGGVPADATAVVLNVTAVSPTAEGYLTVYPADAALPNVSNVNFSPGEIVPNSVQVKLGSLGTGAGRIRIYNFAGQTHVIVDVGGYFRGHDHDDRYYTKAQSQARLAANSLTCPAGSFLNTVAADGTPTCGVGAQGQPGIEGPAGPAGPSGSGPLLSSTATANLETELNGFAHKVAQLPPSGFVDNAPTTSPPFSVVPAVAQTIPADSPITKLRATFVNRNGFNLPGATHLRAHLWVAPGAASTGEVTAANCETPPLFGSVPAGARFTCSWAGNVPVAAGSVAWVEISARRDEPGPFVLQSFTVSASVGIA